MTSTHHLASPRKLVPVPESPSLSFLVVVLATWLGNLLPATSVWPPSSGQAPNSAPPTAADSQPPPISVGCRTQAREQGGHCANGARPVLGAGGRGAAVPGEPWGGPGAACLRSPVVSCGQFPLLPAVEFEAWPGRYFGCTLSHPRPLELRPCILHAITMTTTSNCFLAGRGEGSGV